MTRGVVAGSGADRARRNPRLVLDYNRHGASQDQIAEHFGCHVDTIRRLLSQFTPQERRKLPRSERRADPFVRQYPTPQQVAEAYEQYGTFEAAGKALGWSGSVVHKIARESGVETNPPGRLRDPALVREAVRLYGELGSYAKVADELGYPHGTVRDWLRDAGVKLTGGHPRVARPLAARVCRMYLGGMSCSEIAARVGRTEDGVRRMLHREGVPLRTPHQTMKLKRVRAAKS